MNILSSALKIFLEKGHKKTTLKELTNDSNIGLGSITNIFNGKEELVCELIGYVLSINLKQLVKLLKKKVGLRLYCMQ